MTALEDFLFEPQHNKDWHMQFSERAALQHALLRASPDISIEIGTFLCGSLRSIAAASRNVYTFDIDPSMSRQGKDFPNVQFIIGNSTDTVPLIINYINESDRELNFVLIDGSHSEIGVKTDIANILKYIPKSRSTIVLMHDSANPAVRKGILDAPWAENPFVHALDLDYVPGMIYDREDIRGQIWGGLAAAILLPEKRTGHLNLQASFDFSLKCLIEKSMAMLSTPA